jgi:hypothetical protein
MKTPGPIQINLKKICVPDTFLNYGLNGVMLGDTWSIHEIAKRAGKNYEGHTSRTWKAIMAALDRSPLFEKKYVRLDRLVRYYALKVPVN